MGIEKSFSSTQQQWPDVDCDSEHSLLEEHEHDTRRGTVRHSNAPSRLVYISITAFNLLLLCLSATFFLLRQDASATTRNAAMQATSIYSPILGDVDMRLTDTQMNGSLFSSGGIDSPWRNIPGSTTDDPWDNFELIRTLPLSREQILKMGKDPDKVAKFADGVFGLGDDAYVGALDFFHQVHCLNLLRKAAFSTHDRTSKDQPPDTLEVIHLQHCTSMLMQHLLCTADTGMITYQWVEDNDHPFPDFSVHRQCRDWTQLAEYRDAHAVDLETYMVYTKPEGVKEMAQPKQYWELMKELAGGEENHSHRERT